MLIEDLRNANRVPAQTGETYSGWPKGVPKILNPCSDTDKDGSPFHTTAEGSDLRAAAVNLSHPSSVSQLRLALMESDPRMLPHLPIQRLVECFRAIWFTAHVNVVHEREQPLRVQQILTHVHESAMLAANVQSGHEWIALFPTLALPYLVRDAHVIGPPIH